MTWFKVDDALATHDKVLMAGNAAMGLWVRAGAWSSQHLTDGHVPIHAVRLLGNVSQAKALVTAGLWIKVDDGFRFHEWHDYQPSREKVEAERAEARERMRKLRSGSADVRPNIEDRSPEVRDPSVRDPRPVPSRLSVVTNPSQSSSALAGIDSDGLTRIKEVTKGNDAHALKTVKFILAKAPQDVRNPLAYCLKAIADEPEAYRFRRGNPKKADECPDHMGEWADACRIHASEEIA